MSSSWLRRLLRYRGRASERYTNFKYRNHESQGTTSSDAIWTTLCLSLAHHFGSDASVVHTSRVQSATQNSANAANSFTRPTVN
jgi:hypothetical protein